jgi:hypothetical protein
VYGRAKNTAQLIPGWPYSFVPLWRPVARHAGLPQRAPSRAGGEAVM